MFIIPNFYQDEVSFQEGWNTMKRHGRGDTLEGMNAMNNAWDEYIASQNDLFNGKVAVVAFEDDDEFFDHYSGEVNAYNAVFSNMQPMFA
jgi:hypothetical protein|tara:strand:- start:4106 stop:4375 length:270 start_codon:yes stop_codon:yes gene_type:complete